MSTFVGTPWQPSPFEYRSDIPLDLVARGLATKQAQTTAVQQGLQGQIDTIGNSQIYKDSDRQVINSKLKDTVNSINEFQGQDLLDGTVQNQLMNISSGLSSDPEVIDRLVANRNAGQQLQKVQWIKDHHPEEYSAINENYFHRQLEDWKNNPNQRSFSATYQPYRNTAKWENDAMEGILKNPDIHAEIMYGRDPFTGKPVPRGEREVKEATLAKLHENLLGSLPGDMNGQYQLEFNNALASGGHNIAASVASDWAQRYAEKSSELKAALALAKAQGNKDPETMTAIQNKIDQYDKLVQDSVDTRDKIMNGEMDPSQYLSYGKYVEDRLFNVAKAHAYKQDTKAEYDPMYTAMWKHKWDQEDLRLTAKLKNATSDIADTNYPFANVMDQVFSSRGKATADKATYKALNNMSGKDDDLDFSPKTFNGDNAFVDIRPFIGELASGEDIKSATGHAILTDGYRAWKQSLIKSHASSTGYTSPDGGGYQWPNSGGPTLTPHDLSMHSYVDYLKASGADKAFKDDYNLDLNDPEQVNKSDKIQAALMQKGLDNIGVVLTNLHGNIKLKASSGENTFRASDGSMHTAGIGQGTWKELAGLLTDKKLTVLQNTINPTTGESYLPQIGTEKGPDGKEHPVYQLSLITKPTVDLESAHDVYLRNEFGASYYKDNSQAMKAAFGRNTQENMTLSKYGYDDFKAVGDSIISKDPSQTTEVTQALAAIQSKRLDAKSEKKIKEALIKTYANLNNAR